MQQKSTLSHYLHKARLLTGMSQRQMAERLNISRSSLSRYENGNRLPKTSVLNQIKELLGGSPRQTLVEIIAQREGPTELE